MLENVNRSIHQLRVMDFMRKAKQDTPSGPCKPDEKVRLLRAKLMLEEVLETLRALGVNVVVSNPNVPGENELSVTDETSRLDFVIQGPMDLVEVVDGCADVSVVTIGTLIACGIKDEPVLKAVDENNLAKFGPGHSYREDGKLIKPPGFTKVDLGAVIDRQIRGEE